MQQKVNKHAEKKITSRSEDYSQWYQDIIEAAELAEHGPVKGTMIIKPTGYAIWEKIQQVLDMKIKETGVKNAYFPLLIPERFLQKEQKHIEGFTPEVAVVTYAGGKKLKEALIIRPTSETIIYHAFARWVESHRDLPILINQWANVVRWEARPRLFLRTTEFLWQEGHTAHATKEEAEERALMMMSVYKKFFEEYLAIPSIVGQKSDAERFAGADKTYTLEAMMQDGKALQLATSHDLGQNFSRVFNLNFTDAKAKEHYCYQTSWGVSTRSIGGLIMSHSDDKGLVLPPKIAPTQGVVIPIWNDKKDEKRVMEVVAGLEDLLNKENISFHADMSQKSIGEKFYYWEKRGIPIRVEIGPRDIAKQSVIVVRRDSGDKETVRIKLFPQKISKLLDDIQSDLLDAARERLSSHTIEVKNWEEFTDAIKKHRFILAYWCGDEKVEEAIKEKTGATIRCIPSNQKNEKGKCIYSGKEADQKVIFAKAY